MKKFGSSVIDRALVFAPWSPPGVRSALGRKAARRGLTATALRAAPEDPDVLLDAGMYFSAQSNKQPVARMIGLAGLGYIDEAATIYAAHAKLDERRRLQLARAAAPHSPTFALGVLPESEHEARAACLLALGRPEDAALEISGFLASREIYALQAAIFGALEDHSGARERLNELFDSDRLEAPYQASDQPMSIHEAHATAGHLQGEMPLVTVIMAARNAAATIETALRSLMAQTWRRLEIIVVDDASMDDTLAIVHRLAGEDQRIVALRNQREAGAYGARNTGIASANGVIVAFHDSDDWAHPRRIELQVNALRGRAGSTCQYLRLTDQGQVINPRVFPLLRRNPILLAIQKSMLDNLGPFDPVRVGGDSELLARLEAGVGRWNVTRVSACLVLARWNEASLMADKSTGLSVAGIHVRMKYEDAWRRRHAATFGSPRHFKHFRWL